MSYMIDKAVEAYINEYYPNARLMKHDDPDSDLMFYRMDELAQADRDWFPLCSYKDEETGETVYGGRTDVIHTYMEGETGAGKTTRYVIPTIRALAHTGNKPSFVVADPDGESAENLAPSLWEDGYTVRIVNMPDPLHSDTYDPLRTAVDECLKNGQITDHAMEIVRRVAEVLQPIETTSDPIWDQGARAFTTGCILDKLEDMLAGYLPPDCVTLYNVIQNHFWLRDKLSEGYSAKLDSIPHYRKKGADALSVQKMKAVTDNADKTRASYLGVVENHYDAIGHPSMYRLSSNSTIFVEDMIEKPTAVFVQTGNTQIGDAFVSLIVNQLCQYVKNRGRKNLNKRMPRDIHCFLDEFANIFIANPKDYARMLTNTRKNGMFWHMILQCDSQINDRYGENIATTIRANCTEIYLGSNDYRTQVRFAESCGYRTVESLASRLTGQVPSFEKVPLITPEALNKLEKGYAYVRQGRHDLLLTRLEAFYNCEDFLWIQDMDDVYPVNDFDYTKTRMYPDEYVETERKTVVKEPAAKKDTLPEKDDEIFEDPAEEDRFELEGPTRETVEQAALHDCLEIHLEDYTRSYVESVLTDLTIIPQSLTDAISEIYFIKSDTERKTDSLPANANILKYEIIEEYIHNNDYKSKSMWDRQIKNEVETLQKSGIFPEQIMNAFRDASREIREELSLGNIKYIKRIVSGNV